MITEPGDAWFAPLADIARHAAPQLTAAAP
jgi:hypothetical protein